MSVGKELVSISTFSKTSGRWLGAIVGVRLATFAGGGAGDGAGCLCFLLGGGWENRLIILMES